MMPADRREGKVNDVEEWNPERVAQRGALAQEPTRCHTARDLGDRGRRAAGRRARQEEGGQGGRKAQARDERRAAQGRRRADAQVLGGAPGGQGAGGSGAGVT